MDKKLAEKLWQGGVVTGVGSAYGAIPAVLAGTVGYVTGNSAVGAIAGGLTGGLGAHHFTRHKPVSAAAGAVGALGGAVGGFLNGGSPSPSNPAEELMIPHPALDPEFLYSEIRRLDKVQEEAYKRATVNNIYRQSLAALDGQNSNRIEPHY
jgi:hypothetical protein